MNRITIDNYEAFLLDFMEGNLDDGSVHELKAFVMQHPELEIDLEDLDLPKITNEAIEFHFKSQLKKTDTDNSTELLFDYLENNLAKAVREEIEAKLLKDKALQFEFELLKKTILAADPNEGFHNKTILYKTQDDLLLKDKVLSYFEDQLNTKEKTAFELELKVNPELQKELDLYSKTKVEAESAVTYPEKEELKKWALAYFEGLLSGKDKTDFESELKTNLQLQAELEQYSKTRLIADATLVYPDKEELKKETRIIALFSFRNVAAMAAAILLLLGIFVLVTRYNNSSVVKPELATVVRNEAPGVKTGSAEPASINNIKNKVTNKAALSTQIASVKPTLQVKSGPKNSPVKLVNSQREEDQQTSTLAVEQKKKEGLQKNQLQKENLSEEETLIAQEQKLNKPEQKLLTDTALIPESQEKYTVLVAVEDHDDEDLQPAAKNGFWNKAVRLAKGANKLGVKAIDGAETAHRKFSLSFNAFSVEKH